MRRSPLRAKPPKRAEPIPREARDAIWTRAGGRCEVQIPERCEPWGFLAPHHRLRQQHGGPHTVENLVLVCAADHAYIHAHPDWAYRCGLLIHRQDGPPSERWRGHDSPEKIGFGDA